MSNIRYKQPHGKSNIVTPGIHVVCPICGEPLSRAEMGVHSHLSRHVRKGEMAQADVRLTVDKVIGKVFKGERSL